MQVFNLYFKLLRANLKSFFIYIGIFAGLIFGVIIPNQTQDQNTDYIASKCDFAVWDQDQSTASEAIVRFLETKHVRKEINDFTPDTIQDQLFYREIDAAIVIQPGFEESLKKGTTEESVTFTVIPNTMNASLIQQDFNGFLSRVRLYLTGHYSLEKAIAKTNEVSELTIDVQFAEGQAQNNRSVSYSFFVYLTWIFLSVCIQSVAPVLSIMDRKEVKNRVSVSAYRFSLYNLETLLSTILTGVGICLLFLLAAFLFLPESLISIQGLLWTGNMLCFMVVSMSFTLLASKLTTNPQVISVFSNIVSLGMAFTCGVFVPLELLSDKVIQVAHFLPAYWYVQAVELINSNPGEHLQTIFTYMGIELLFGGAIIAVAFLIAKKKQG